MKNIDILSTTLQPAEKFNSRALLSSNAIIHRRIKHLETLDYKVFKHSAKISETERNGLLIIILVHQTRLEYIEQAIESALSQETERCFVTIIDHGTEGRIADYLRKTFLDHDSITLITVRENLMDPWSGDNVRAVNLWNAAIFCSECAYAYFLSCDDYLSTNYSKSMLALFDENPQCTSAAPGIISVDENNKVNTERTQNYIRYNRRPRYTNGVELATDYMNGGGLFISPGGTLVQKIDILYTVGGFDFYNDVSQIVKIAIKGISGFEPMATLYWRHHSGQTNKSWTKLGIVQYEATHKYYSEHKIWELQNYEGGIEFATMGKNFFFKMANDDALNTVRLALLGFGLPSALKAVRNIKKQCPSLLPRASIIVLVNLPRGIANNYLPRRVKNLLKALHKAVRSGFGGGSNS